MYLRDYLQDIPLKALKAIADSLGVTVEYRARIKLVNAIDRAFWDRSLVEHLIENLSDLHRHALSLIAFSYNAGVLEEALFRKMKRLTGIQRQQIRNLIHDLIPLALVGGIREEKNLYFCPEGIAEQIRKVLIVSAVNVTDKRETTFSITQPNLLEDIFSFLARVYKKNIPLTLMGKVKKTDIERIFEGSPTCADQSLHLSKDFRNAFVMKYLKERQLVMFDRHKAKVTQNLYGWLHLSMTDRYQDIISFALLHTFQDSRFLITLSGIFAEMPAGTSFNVKGFSQFLYERTMSSGDVKRISSRLNDLLSILFQMGLLSFTNGRFAMTETGMYFFRTGHLSLDETMGSHFTIQPNFEVIVGPELHPTVRFVLELMASRKNRNTVSTYLVAREGIACARERGMSTDDIIRFFDEHSRNPVPQNVRFSIETWANNFGRIFFENAVLMRFRDTATCNSIIHLPEIEPYILEHLSDTVLVVSSEHISLITALLKKAGYIPEVFGETPQDYALSGSEFSPNYINDFISMNKMPDVHHAFIFPQQLLPYNNTR